MKWIKWMIRLPILLFFGMPVVFIMWAFEGEEYPEFSVLKHWWSLIKPPFKKKKKEGEGGIVGREDMP